ncbi:MFS transporter [Dietzia sp.]|uniref:MFS transporter n=1 Tax=Dietzia sp. TaxID=1871616 RepID=UPI002FDA2421
MSQPPSAETAQVATPAPSDGLDPRRWIALTFICVAQLMVVLDGTVVNIALPHAKADLGIPDAHQQWVITAYALAFGGLLLFGGRLADLWGRRRTLMIGLVGFAVSSALGGAAVNTGMLLGARALQGVFAALLAPAALSLITVMFTLPRERARAFGIFGAIAGAGAAVGLLLGGVLTEYTSWRWTMYINIIFALVALVGAIFEIREPEGHGGAVRLDIPGVILASSGLALVVYGFSRAAEESWTDTWTIVSLIAAVVLLALFAVTQTRVAHPLLPPRVITERNRGGAYLSIGLAVTGMFGTFLFMTFYLQTVLGFSALKSGFAFLPMVAGMMIGSTQIGARLVTKLPPRYLMVPGLSLGALGLLWMSRMHVDSSYWALVVPGLVALGLGMGTNFMASMNLATHGVEPRDAGVASAMVNTSQQVGGAIGTALLNTIATTAATRYADSHMAGITSPEAGQRLQLEAMVNGFSHGLIWAACFLFAAAIAAAVLINTKEPVGGRH